MLGGIAGIRGGSNLKLHPSMRGKCSDWMLGVVVRSRCHRAEFKGQDVNRYLRIAAEQTECPDFTVGTVHVYCLIHLCMTSEFLVDYYATVTLQL